MLVKINNRLQQFPDGLTFRKVQKGLYKASYNGRDYIITGGKAAGGAHNEWFLDTPDGGKPYYTTGLVDSLRLIVQM